MLESLRNAAKSWVAKTLILLLAGSFGIWGIADVFRGFHAGALATVGGLDVSADEFNQAFNRTLQQLSQQSSQPLTPDEARKLGIDRSVLNSLVQQAAVDDLGRNLNLAVSDRQIVKEAQSNPAFHDSKGKFDAAQFQRLLEANGMNEQMYLARIREDKLRAAITGTVDGSFAAPKPLVEAFYREKNEQRDARYFVVKTEESEVPAPADADIKKYYDEHPAAFTAPEYRTIAYMKADPGDVAARVALSEEDIKAGYEKYKADYFIPEKRTVFQISFPTIEAAQKAKERIASGTDFMAVAKDMGVSEADATFADKTKDDFLDPAIAEAAFKLPEGALSEPVKGNLSIALLKSVKIAPEHQKTLDEVKDELSQRLKLERAREEIQSVYDTVEDARAAQTKFEDIAAKSNIPFKIVTHIDANGQDKDGKDTELPLKVEVLKAAFASDVGVENQALSIEDTYVWYEVREVVPSAVKLLDTVRDQAKKDFIASKVRELSLDKAKKLAERARGGVSLELLAEEAKAEIKTTKGLKRNEPGAEFDNAQVTALFAEPMDGYAYAIEGDGKGARVMQSQPVLLPPFDEKSDEAKAIAKSLEGSVSNDLLASYISTVEKQAGVSVNETLWRQLAGGSAQ